jgi:hypothetical protein
MSPAEPWPGDDVTPRRTGPVPGRRDGVWPRSWAGRAQHRGCAARAGRALRATPYMFDNWSQTLPYTHRVANADTLPLHYVVAEWLAPSGPDAPALPDGSSGRLLKEGPTTRVYQITLTPGAATEAHTHATPGLTVLGTAGALSGDGSPQARGGTGAGSWSWREARFRHVLRNDGPAPVVIYEIDWR